MNLGRLSDRHFIALLAVLLVVIAVAMFALLSLLGDLSGWRNFQG